MLFVQVNQLDDFCWNVLPQILGPFTLITGKWHLPALQKSEYVTTILASRHLNRWYSPSQVFDDLPILPFPFGVKLSSAPHVYWRTRLELANAIFEYIEVYYNRSRRHSALQWDSPTAFEAKGRHLKISA